MLLKLP